MKIETIKSKLLEHKIGIIILLLTIGTILCACSNKAKEAYITEAPMIVDEEIDVKLNTREGNISYDASLSSESELSTSENVLFKTGYHMEFSNSKNSDLYIATYRFENADYTAGYAKSCDFKEYLNLPNIISAEAIEQDGFSYTIASYENDVKVAYYYPAEHITVYIQTEETMEMDDFIKNIKTMDIKLQGEIS